MVIFGVVILDRIVPILLGGVGGAASLAIGLLLELMGGPNTATTDLVVIASLLSAGLFGPLAALVAHRKNLGWSTGFIFGFGFGLIGLVLMLSWRPPRAAVAAALSRAAVTAAGASSVTVQFSGE